MKKEKKIYTELMERYLSRCQTFTKTVYDDFDEFVTIAEDKNCAQEVWELLEKNVERNGLKLSYGPLDFGEFLTQHFYLTWSNRKMPHRQELPEDHA